MIYNDIYVVKHSDIRTCLLWNLKGNPGSEGTKSILGINILSPMFLFVITFVEMTSSLHD